VVITTTDEAPVGHLTIWGQQPAPYQANPSFDVYGGLVRDAIVNSFAGEAAHLRLARLAAEDGTQVSISPVADGGDVMRMGFQRPATAIDLYRQCAAADGGLLFEMRGDLGFAYRPRSTLYNQTPVQLSYSGGYISAPFEPIDDDAATRNDITVTRTGGSSARAVQSTGPLAALEPPAGVGAYEVTADVNTATDSVLADIAGWKLHLGTVDESRYPRIRVDLTAAAWTGNQALRSQAAALDCGDTIEVTGLPAWLPSSTTRAMILGYTETLDAYDWDITWTAVPGSPWDVAAVDGEQRVAADGSTLTAGITSSATTLQITSTAANGVWTVDAADFPFDINLGGEQITLSAISGAASPQTATVTARAVNGIVKAHVTGEAIDVWLPGIVAL